ncbi:MAG TPA: RDD family protein [Microlunatus sp.]|nr:RDD family protein [Microlunatus sp.]
MSDIPIGTPPSPPGRHAAPSGWYPDPIDAAQERYWDGWQWSRTTRPREMAAGQGGGYAGHSWPGGQPHDQGSQSDGAGQYGAGQYGSGQYGSGQNGSGQNGSGPYGSERYGQAQQPGQYGQPGPYGELQPYGQNQPAPYRAAPLGGGAQAAYTEDGVRLSGWWWRVLAAWLDSVFVSLIVLLPAFPIYQRMYASLTAYIAEVFRAAQAGQAAPPQPDVTTFLSGSDQTALLLIQLGVALVYNIAFLRWKSATPGKLICGLRVVPVDRGQSRERLGWGTVVVRVLIWVLPSISSLLLLFRLIDGLFPLWQPKRQALHDLAARTQVVRPA